MGRARNEEQATYPSTHPSITHPLIHPALPTCQAHATGDHRSGNTPSLLSWVTSWWETDIKTTDRQLMTFLTVHLVQAWGLEKLPWGGDI